MSVHYKSLPVGIDFEIDRMQRHFSQKLNGLTQNSEWYPRVYPVPIEGKDSSKEPMHFEVNKDYKSVFYNDAFDLMVFFLAEPEAQYEDPDYTRRVSMVVQANLRNLYPGITHRADEELHMAIHNAWKLSPIKKLWKIESMETEIENVFREFDRSKINLTDMQPRHCVRFNFTVKYEPKCCTNC